MFKKHVLAEAGNSSSKAFKSPSPPLQRGNGGIGARSVLLVREYGKRARTPLEAFFNIPNMKKGEVPENLPSRFLMNPVLGAKNYRLEYWNLALAPF